MALADPPTLVSGFGVLSDSDMGKAPPLILDSHEKTVKRWLELATPEALKASLDSCYKNTHFAQFKRDLWDSVEERKFGEEPAEDILRFDLWLKKLEISEAMSSKTVAKPAPTKTTSPSTASSELPAPPANPEAYKAYWDQYKRKGACETLRTPS